MHHFIAGAGTKKEPPYCQIKNMCNSAMLSIYQQSPKRNLKNSSGGKRVKTRCFI
jgi:hypothetical protein